MFVVVPIDYSLLTPSFVEALHGKPMEGEFKLEVESNDVNMDGLPTCGYITVHDKRFWIHLGSSPETQGCRVRRVDTTSEDPVLKSFGGVWTKFYPRSKDENLQKWLMNKLSDVIEYRTDGARWLDRIKMMQPMRSQLVEGKVSIYQTLKDLDNDRNVAMKPGRAFKCMYPELPAHVIEEFVDTYRANFFKRDFTLVVSKEADAFIEAYAHTQCEMQNPNTSCSRKSLCNSCMRYDFAQLPIHPVAAYASGDFDIVYLKDSMGHIAARCVVYTSHANGKMQAGPIYGVCEHSLDKVQDYLIEQDAVLSNHADWRGARLVRTEHEDGFVAPYLDIQPQSLEDTGEYLVVAEHGSINASDYSGLLNSHDCHCAECDEGLSEDETCYSEYNDNSYCECCYNELHFYCNYIQESYHNDQAVEVWSVTRSGSFNRETVSDDARDSFFVLCTDGEYWNTDDAIHCEFTDEYASPREMENGDYFMSDWDCEVYPMSQFCILNNDESVSKQELDDDVNDWELNDNGTWSIVQQEEELCIA